MSEQNAALVLNIRIGILQGYLDEKKLFISQFPCIQTILLVHNSKKQK